jgi:hypothetical protein
MTSKLQNGDSIIPPTITQANGCQIHGSFADSRVRVLSPQPRSLVSVLDASTKEKPPGGRTRRRGKIIEHRGYDTAIGVDDWPLDRRHPVYRQSTSSPRDPVKSASLNQRVDFRVRRRALCRDRCRQRNQCQREARGLLVRAMVSWLPSSCAASSWPCTSHPVR